MKLLQICEPLFQYICRLKRLGRTGNAIETEQVRLEVKNLFKEMRQKSLESGQTAALYEQVELPLTFFVDYMIKENQFGLTSPWHELAADQNEYAGDEKFFDLLDETLAEGGPESQEKLVIYYTCLAIGFMGIYAGQPSEIHQLMNKISTRIATYMDADERASICPEAYEHVDTRNFIEPPGVKLTGIGIALVGLIVVWFLGYILLFHIAGRTVNKGIDTIQEYEEIDEGYSQVLNFHINGNEIC